MKPFPLMRMPSYPPPEGGKQAALSAKEYLGTIFPEPRIEGDPPYDWRERATLEAAMRAGYLPILVPSNIQSMMRWHTFKQVLETVETDPERPGWDAFRLWALSVLNTDRRLEPAVLPTWPTETPK